MGYMWTDVEINLLHLILQLRGLTQENIYKMFNTIALHLYEKSQVIPYFTNKFPRLTEDNKEARTNNSILKRSFLLRKTYGNLQDASFTETPNYEVYFHQILKKIVEYITNTSSVNDLNNHISAISNENNKNINIETQI